MVARAQTPMERLTGDFVTGALVVVGILVAPFVLPVVGPFILLGMAWRRWGW